jgi:hypothetical protein
MRKFSMLAVIVCCAMLQTHAARATFHFWQIDQVYSNASGSVQYIDLVLPIAFDDESHVGGHAISAGLGSHSFVLPSNLPAVPVVGQHFLIATPGFADLAHVQPDYTLPAGPFFNPAGDTLNWAGVDSLIFPALPTDGLLARNRDGSLELNTPTNFSGTVGFVPEPAGISLALLAAAGFGVVARFRRQLNRNG